MNKKLVKGAVLTTAAILCVPFIASCGKKQEPIITEQNLYENTDSVLEKELKSFDGKKLSDSDVIKVRDAVLSALKKKDPVFDTAKYSDRILEMSKEAIADYNSKVQDGAFSKLLSDKVEDLLKKIEENKANYQKLLKDYEDHKKAMQALLDEMNETSNKNNKEFRKNLKALNELIESYNDATTKKFAEIDKTLLEDEALFEQFKQEFEEYKEETATLIEETTDMLLKQDEDLSAAIDQSIEDWNDALSDYSNKTDATIKKIQSKFNKEIQDLKDSQVTYELSENGDGTYTLKITDPNTLKPTDPDPEPTDPSTAPTDPSTVAPTDPSTVNPDKE